MLQYEKMDVAEGIDINKISASKERKLCQDWYFKDVGFKLVSHVCNKCHYVWITAYKLKKHCNIELKRSWF